MQEIRNFQRMQLSRMAFDYQKQDQIDSVKLFNLNYFAILEQFTNIECLELNNLNLKKSYFKSISAKLRELTLNHCYFDKDDCSDFLRDFPNLETLQIELGRIYNNQLKWGNLILRDINLEKLKKLKFSCENINLDYLSDSKNEELGLDDLDFLKKASNLSVLDLNLHSSIEIKEETLKELKKIQVFKINRIEEIKE